MLRYEQKSKWRCHRPARGLINSSVVREVLIDDGMRALGHSVGDLQGGSAESLCLQHLWDGALETLLLHPIGVSSDVISPACAGVRLVYGLRLEIQTHALLNI